jgi:hypothetical protein
LKTRKVGANPPKHVFGVFYDIRERSDPGSNGSCPIFFLSKTFFDGFAPLLPI